MTTLQDLGRPGYQRFGIPVSGALDAVALCAANAIVGNPSRAAGLEIVYQGPTLLVEAESIRVALVGGTAGMEVLPDRTATTVRSFQRLQSVRVYKGQALRIGALGGSAVGYLAVEGGFDIPMVLGSQSTFVRAGLGGLEGRRLRAGDLLPLRQDRAIERSESMLPSLDLSRPERFRVVFGPQDDHFSGQAKQTLLESTYTVSAASDRMGMRLDGPVLGHANGYNIVSDGIAPGSIQVPGDGLPIVLLADRQTTGGYPKIATVISADIPALGRLLPGDTVAFQAVDIDVAEAAHSRHAACIAALPQLIVLARPTATVDEAALMGANLVSGMIDAAEANWEPPMPDRSA
jgi:biotin-dependent carboxylase-like uncharacterized protein